MIYCRGCGKTIHETAVACPHCAAVTNPTPAKPPVNKVSLGLSILGIVLGALAFAGLMGTDVWDKDTLVGAAFVFTLGLAFGVFNVSRPHTRDGLAIAAVIVCAIGLLTVLGSI